MLSGRRIRNEVTESPAFINLNLKGANMTKQELIAHFQEQKKIIEREIVFWLAQPDAEAEKPKRRHGDFGYSDKPIYPRIVLNDNKLATAYHVIDDNKSDRPTVIFGNIFDLLKEWSEDLEYFEFDIHRCEINTMEFPHAPIHFAGNWHTLSEIEEIRDKTSRVIATLKRKQSLT